MTDAPINLPAVGPGERLILEHIDDYRSRARSVRSEKERALDGEESFKRACEVVASAYEAEAAELSLILDAYRRIHGRVAR